MGSSFLLANGLGTPVADATTSVTFPQSGKWRVWCRTRDWVATWQGTRWAPKGDPPGRFQLVVDGKPLATTFGTTSAKWHWQKGDVVDVPSGRKLQLALRDLTGFDGRCDAILFVREGKEFTPPEGDALAKLRTELLGHSAKPIDAGEYDFVVVGGGIAGICAAVSGARQGLTVALIQDRPVLGGNNSSEVRVWLQGAKQKTPWPNVGSIVAQLEQKKAAHYGPDNKGELYEDDKKLKLVQAEKNIKLFLLHRMIDAEVKDGKITSVIALQTRTSQKYRFRGKWFADCTGDGCLGGAAGADFEMTIKGHLGRCNLWHVGDVGKATSFPRCPWALDLAEKPFPGRTAKGINIKQLGGWYWESGFTLNPLEKSEYIRDWNFRAAFGAWDAIKNTDKKLPNHKLLWMAHISGKRESRRLLGDHILSKEDVLQYKLYPDGCAPTGWNIDLHYPDKRYQKGFEGNEFIAKAIHTKHKNPYWIPYRCLYSRNIENLLMAGRCMSATHEAFGAIRVMRTGGCCGEIIGMAAAVCKEKKTTPRGVYKDHLGELQKKMRGE